MKTISFAIARSMLLLQDTMNRKIHPHWEREGFAFLRAVLVESAEALEHYGWKWWKKQQPDMVQLRIELVDIWHFLLSSYLVRSQGEPDNAALYIVREWTSPPDFKFDEHTYQLSTLDMHQRLELLAALSAVRRIHLPLVVSLFESCQMSVESLYLGYVSKNILNHFRQDHGYKTGEYVKIWAGREDNEHMDDLLKNLNPESADLPERLYDALRERYRELVGPTS